MKRRECVTRRPALPAKFNLTKRKEGGNLPPALIETRPRRVPRRNLTKEVLIMDPGCAPKREAGMTNPEAGTPCKNTLRR